MASWSSWEKLEERFTIEYGNPVAGNWLCTTFQIAGKKNSGLFLTRIGELYGRHAWSLVLLTHEGESVMIRYFSSPRKLKRFLSKMDSANTPGFFGRKVGDK